MALLEKEIASQSSWVLSTAEVELAVTKLGAQMAPVYFFRGDAAPVQPYYISPWQVEKLDVELGGSEFAQRGDFFCLPFGVDHNDDALEIFPPHGEACAALWALVSSGQHDGVHRLTVERELHSRPGKLVRSLSLVDGQNVIYDTVEIHGFAGAATFAHHAMLRAPRNGGMLNIATSPLGFGMTAPHPTADPEGGSQALATAREFTSLSSVPAISGDTPADCTQWPTRKGCTDLLQFANEPTVDGFAWTAAVNESEGYVWFALKDAMVLPSVIMWMEDCARIGPPYSARTCVIGLEDACTYFDRGIPESVASNAFSERGVPTHKSLSGDPFSIRYIQGAARVPACFGCVVEISATASGIEIRDDRGNAVRASVQLTYLGGAALIR